MAAVDYSKWDKMQKDEEVREEVEKERKRMKNKFDYMKSQEEKKQKWKEAHPGEEPHQHKHRCGFADPADLEKLRKERDALPKISPEEKLRKKLDAVEATREHGNILFKEGKFEHAYQVYERGALIINGMVDTPEDVYQKLLEVEIVLDLNMALCQIRLEQYEAAIDSARMAMNIRETSKAHYRIGQAKECMGDFAGALEEFQKSLDMEPANEQVQVKLVQVKQALREQRKKAKEAQRAFGKRLKAQASPTPASTQPPPESS